MRWEARTPNRPNLPISGHARESANPPAMQMKVRSGRSRRFLMALPLAAFLRRNRVDPDGVRTAGAWSQQKVIALR